MSSLKIHKLDIPGEQALTLVTFLVSLPTCTFVGLGDGLRLFRSFSSLLGGLDLILTTENVYSLQEAHETKPRSQSLPHNEKVTFFLGGHLFSEEVIG